MSTIRPCLWFNTDIVEAAQYYVSIFPNSSIDQISYWGPEAGEFGPKDPMLQGQPLVVAFTLDGQAYTAVNGGADFPFTPAVSFEVQCADQAQVDYYWQALGAGGQEIECGWLTDRYGLAWQIVPQRLGELMTDPDPARVQRVTHAMHQMVKLDVAALEAAAEVQ